MINAVVIVTYNRLDLLKHCLKHVECQTTPFDYIIVVDNNSSDGTDTYLNSWVVDNPNGLIFRTEQNLGGAGGFSFGMSKVPNNVDNVLLIDDDAIIEYDFLESILSHYSSDVHAYSGSVLTDGLIDTTHRRRLTNKTFMLKTDVDISEYSKDCFYYDLSSFCGLVISKSIVDQIGLPKQDYFIWYDDTEYSLRLKPFTKIMNVNQAKIDHRVKINNSKTLTWKSYYGYRNQIDIGKHYSDHSMLYLLYRYSYHLYRITQNSFLFLKTKNDYYLECAKLHGYVLKDSFNNKLGISEKYYPGMIIG